MQAALEPLLSALWGLAILLALYGWGSVVGRLLLPRPAADAGLRLALGLAVAVTVGGVLNLFYAISREGVLLFVAAGAGLGALGLWRERAGLLTCAAGALRACRGDWVLAVGALFALALATLAYLGAAHNVRFNPHDDLQGHFVFPAKMLQLGSMGMDPYSERRTIVALGGQSFLLSLVLAVRGFESLHLIDVGLGTLVTLALLLGLCRRLGLSARAQLLVLLAFLLFPVPLSNITSTRIAAALLLALFSAALREPTREELPGTALAIGLLAGAACTTKTTILPTVGLAAALWCGFELLRPGSRVRTAAWCAAAAATTAAVTLPWMLSMHESSGTLLYPLLGRGTHATAYGTFATPTAAMGPLEAIRILGIAATSPPGLSLGLLCAVLVGSLGVRRLLADRASVVIGAAVLGTLVTALASGGVATDRYIHPILLPAVLVLLARALALGSAPALDGAPAAALATLCGVALIGAGWNDTRVLSQDLARDVVRGLRGARIATSAEREQIRAAQQSLPAGAPVLERVALPFLFDFARNPVWIADYPGAASPAPGMPSFQGEEALAAFLVAHDARYVVYSYADEAKFTRAEFGFRLEPGTNPWIFSEASHTFDFQDNLARLRESRKRLYDDGAIVVLDLASPAAAGDGDAR